MTLFGETILLAEDEYPPNILAHMKKLHTAVKDGLVVKVYYNKGKNLALMPLSLKILS